MERYGRDFMGQVRGMWDRFTGQGRRGGGSRYGGDYRRPMEATGPGGEGYFLSRDMARGDYGLDYSDRGWDDVGDRGFMPGDIAQFGSPGRGRGYGGDYNTGRGGRDAGEFFVNRQGGNTGYHGGYQRDLGMQGRGGYGADYTYGGFARGYDRGYRGGPPDRGGHLDRGPRYGVDYRTPFPRPYGR
ncbi:hypothetical protein [Longimicrobium sp.]|uniref:hypothetical protein n=1 Tax=Longimicrobium sp. TaxID=2029185 RepID=UPI002E378C20|nr:hypothetical protein [Longimicrobium sp.]HEX6041843.1 hypothetical protein [Longimicrobium sp.]